MNMVDSVMLQIIDLEFAKAMVSQLLAIEAEKPAQKDLWKHHSPVRPQN